MSLAPEPKWLRQEAVVILHDENVALHGGPIGVRDEALLESALARPENLFAYSQPDIFDIAAMYASGIIRNHPFVDGNKRAGFLAAAVFIEISGFRLMAGEADAAQKTTSLAGSELAEADYAAWLRQNSASKDD